MPDLAPTPPSVPVHPDDVVSPGATVYYGNHRELATVVGTCTCSQCGQHRRTHVTVRITSSGRKLPHVQLASVRQR